MLAHTVRYCTSLPGFARLGKSTGLSGLSMEGKTWQTVKMLTQQYARACTHSRAHFLIRRLGVSFFPVTDVLPLRKHSTPILVKHTILSHTIPELPFSMSWQVENCRPVQYNSVVKYLQGGRGLFTWSQICLYCIANSYGHYHAKHGLYLQGCDVVELNRAAVVLLTHTYYGGLEHFGRLQDQNLRNGNG